MVRRPPRGPLMNHRLLVDEQGGREILGEEDRYSLRSNRSPTRRSCDVAQLEVVRRLEEGAQSALFGSQVPWREHERHPFRQTGERESEHAIAAWLHGRIELDQE